MSAVGFVVQMDEIHTRTTEIDVNTRTRHYSLQMRCPIVLQDTLVDIQFVDKRYFPELAPSTCREMVCPKTMTLVLTGPFIDC